MCIIKLSLNNCFVFNKIDVFYKASVFSPVLTKLVLFFILILANKYTLLLFGILT